MAPSPAARPEALAAAMADGASIDWTSVDDAAGSQAALIRQLRVIAALRDRGRTAPPAVRQGSLLRVVAAVFGAALVLAAVKVAVALITVPAVLASSPASPINGPFAFNVACFGLGGALLLVGGGADRRLRLLGGLFVAIAAAFVGPFMPAGPGVLGAVGSVLALCNPEAFMALGVWLFAWAFPQEPLTTKARRVASVAVTSSLVAGLLMFAANVVRLLWLDAPVAVQATLAAFDRDAPHSLHWPLLFALALPAIPFLALKARRVGADDRRRVTWFLVALGVGLLPMVVAVIATPLVPALRDAGVRHRVGVALYIALASVVPMTAYAVAVNRVMTLEFVLRATLKYALARYAIWAVILAPLSYLVLDVVVHRGLTFVQYLDLRQPAGLLGLSAVGLVALTARPHLVSAVDRWFLREPIDAPQALARLEHRFRTSEHLALIGTALAEELTAALHAEHVGVFFVADDGRSLVSLEGAAPALPRASVLADLLASARSELHLDAVSTIAQLLPEPDQDWLEATGARLLAPLTGSSGSLLGVVAIGNSLAGLPFTSRHVALVTAMCGQAALQLENRWLRQARQEPAAALPGGGAVSVAWQDEPAAWCPACARTWSAETKRCRCGAATKPAVLPLVVNAKFRLQRVLGAGGTGVVYLATDLALGRQVALKSLPPMRREYAERLRREARAMATVRHPNLATIYGAEEWQDSPLLVVEYLDGGTLADWLARGPMPVDEVLDLGIMLADVLDRVHGSGVLHRDIKPSNIGYTADGVPKLLDFGLAAMLDRSQGADAAPPVLPPDPGAIAARFGGLEARDTLTITNQVVGTPLYLSPEAVAGAAPHESFDLWSLHMVLYEALAGRHPLSGRTVPDVVDSIQRVVMPELGRPDCPAAVAAYFEEALSLEPARRPGAAGDVRSALRALRTRL